MRVNDEHTEGMADADLVLRTRSGEAAAFGELWRRHYASGMSVARAITSSIDPDDLVQESYTRIYQAILKGGGPNGSFRAYLFTSIRNTAAAWGRSRRETAIDELDAVADPSSTEQASLDALDRGLTAQAFRSLPSRWQEVLWYTEIEQMKPAEVGPLLGMKAGAVSQLAFRAREGLREAWIQAHLRSAPDDSECRWTIEHLGAHARGNLGARDRKRLDDHLAACARCSIVAAEAEDVSRRLALVLLPLVLGVTGATGYLATLQGAGAPIVAFAAMPSSVMEGAIVATGPATGGMAVLGTAAGGSTTASGVASGGSSSAASGGTAGGGLGTGALVGAGGLALVIAGAVAAAAVVPGILNPAPTTSQPSAGDSESSSIATEVAPDPSMSLEEPVVIEVPDEPPAPAPETPAPPVVAPAPAPAPSVSAARSPAPAPTPSPTPDDEDEGTGTETTQPPTELVPPETVDPTEPTEPVDPVEPTTPPEPEPEPEPEPVFPATAISWGQAIVFGNSPHIDVPLSGEPGATVQVLLDDAAAPTYQTVFSSDGWALTHIDMTRLQRDEPNTLVRFRYVLQDGTTSPETTTTLGQLIGTAGPQN